MSSPKLLLLVSLQGAPRGTVWIVDNTGLLGLCECLQHVHNISLRSWARAAPAKLPTCTHQRAACSTYELVHTPRGPSKNQLLRSRTPDITFWPVRKSLECACCQNCLGLSLTGDCKPTAQQRRRALRASAVTTVVLEARGCFKRPSR